MQRTVLSKWQLSGKALGRDRWAARNLVSVLQRTLIKIDTSGRGPRPSAGRRVTQDELLADLAKVNYRREACLSPVGFRWRKFTTNFLRFIRELLKFLAQRKSCFLWRHFKKVRHKRQPTAPRYHMLGEGWEMWFTRRCLPNQFAKRDTISKPQKAASLMK